MLDSQHMSIYEKIFSRCHSLHCPSYYWKNFFLLERKLFLVIYIWCRHRWHSMDIVNIKCDAWNFQRNRMFWAEGPLSAVWTKCLWECRRWKDLPWIQLLHAEEHFVQLWVQLGFFFGFFVHVHVGVKNISLFTLTWVMLTFVMGNAVSIIKVL